MVRLQADVQYVVAKCMCAQFFDICRFIRSLKERLFLAAPGSSPLILSFAKQICQLRVARPVGLTRLPIADGFADACATVSLSLGFAHVARSVHQSPVVQLAMQQCVVHASIVLLFFLFA